ncbi:MAG: Stp1/IreP family PP2C-type Ser/Thr phosphatase [candidate division Zixibacteria bacterium]|nr:Stp1/IreP family PP2C-type Ser/Thr phosphatase [candidate division Zixibacteria bacterium]
MDIQCAGKTDIGLVREANEDSFRLLPHKNLYIVCDGMGGHSAGEVASATACDIIVRLYDQGFERLLQDDHLRLPRLFPPSTDVLTKAVRIANHWIYHLASSDSSMSGMGTTIVAAAIEEDIITILHVGDSRVYRYNDGILERLTIDHSWAAEIEQAEHVSAEEARRMVNRNVITRALGVRETAEIDVAIRKIVSGDTYILCSDGLCGLVKDDDIRRVIAGGHGDVETIAGQLIELANNRGGTDNVSVIAVKTTGEIEPSTLTEMATVTVDPEPPEFFPIEEEWVTGRDNPSGATPPNGKKSGSRLFRVTAAVAIVILLAFLFYMVFKG